MTLPERPTRVRQIGFAQVALMKVLLTAEYPERQRWTEQFEAIETGSDAKLLVVEAKLQMKHDIGLQASSTDRPPRLQAAESNVPRESVNSCVSVEVTT